MKRWMLAAVSLLVATTAAAQNNNAPPPTPAPSGAPRLSPEGRKFVEGFLGSWASTDATYKAGGQALTGTMKLNCEAVSAGWGTLCRVTSALPGMPPSSGTVLLAWDMATGTAHMFEVMDTGEVHDHAGQWTSGERIALVRQGRTLEGKDEKDACTAAWVTPRELKFDCTGTQAGATVWTFTSTNRK